MKGRTVGRVAHEAWLPITLFALCWVLTARSESLFFPSLASVLSDFRELWMFERVPTDVLPTIATLLAAMVASVAIGVIGGIFFGLTPWWRRVFEPFLQFGWAVPKLAILPIFIAAFGIGHGMRVAFVTVGTIWPILIGTISGIDSVEREVVAVCRTYRLPMLLRLTHVYLPSAGPQIMAGVRTSLQLGIGIVVFSEMISAPSGMGYFLVQSQSSFNIPGMWSGILLLGIIGYLFSLLLRVIENGALGWHRGRSKTHV